MNIKKVLFVGLGGAGQRHLRILRDLLPTDVQFLSYRRTGKTPLLRSDFSVDNSGSVAENFSLKLFDTLEAAFNEKPDLTVISTPTACHKEPLMMAAASGSNIIVEKPWAEDLEGFDDFYQLVKEKKSSFLISFQRRYHPLILKSHDLLKLGKIGRPIAASFTVFSDVRTWHNYEDWKSLYAVRPELGGGVLLTEIHEIDLAYWFFGLPQKVVCSGGNRSEEVLEIEDTVQLTLLYTSFSVQITLCFMHKNKSRSFYIAGTSGDISWNEADNKLIHKTFDISEQFTVSSFSNDSMFVAQTSQFLSNWTSKDTRESLDSAYASLAIVEAAKRSMASGNVEEVPAVFNY